MSEVKQVCSESSYRVAEHALDHLLRPLCEILQDHEVTEVMINAFDQIWVERSGGLHKVTQHLPERGVMAAVRLLSTLSETMSLERDGTLEGHWRGWRVTAVMPPVSRDSACICLRRHRATALDLNQWQIRPPVTPLPDACTLKISSPQNQFKSLLNQPNGILISGSTGAGKTTFLGSLMAQFSESERIVTLEDTPELPISCAHQLRLVARRGHSLRSLVKLALRLRPDRIVIGEVRGGEAFDLVQAMSTGHAGCLGTIHASSARGALARMEQLILTAHLDWPIEAIQSQLAQWVRVLIHLSRDTTGRFIREVLLVEGIEKGHYVLSPIPLTPLEESYPC